MHEKDPNAPLPRLHTPVATHSRTHAVSVLGVYCACGILLGECFPAAVNCASGFAPVCNDYKLVCAYCRLASIGVYTVKVLQLRLRVAVTAGGQERQLALSVAAWPCRAHPVLHCGVPWIAPFAAVLGVYCAGGLVAGRLLPVVVFCASCPPHVHCTLVLLHLVRVVQQCLGNWTVSQCAYVQRCLFRFDATVIECYATPQVPCISMVALTWMPQPDSAAEEAT